MGFSGFNQSGISTRLQISLQELTAMRVQVHGTLMNQTGTLLYKTVSTEEMICVV